MGPKYNKGTRVRIKAYNFLGMVLDPKIQNYENMIGEILDSVNIVAFLGNSVPIQGTRKHITIYHYTVKINDQTTLQDVLEDCLQAVD